MNKATALLISLKVSEKWLLSLYQSTMPRLICGAGAVGFNVLVNTSKAMLFTAHYPLP